MYHVSAQGIDERMINVHYYYYDHAQKWIKAFTLIIVIDNFCIALFSGAHNRSALYNILQHFLSFTNVIHIIMTTTYNIHKKYKVHVPYEKQQYINKKIIILLPTLNSLPPNPNPCPQLTHMNTHTHKWIQIR